MKSGIHLTNQYAKLRSGCIGFVDLANASGCRLTITDKNFKSGKVNIHLNKNLTVFMGINDDNDIVEILTKEQNPELYL